MSRTWKHKPWYKPGRDFKKPKRQRERAKTKQALKEGAELPVTKHSDVWEFI